MIKVNGKWDPKESIAIVKEDSQIDFSQPTEKRQYVKSLEIDFFFRIGWAHGPKSRYDFDLPRSATRDPVH